MMARVVRTYTYATPNHPRGTVTRVLVLQCGHEQRRKGSSPVPNRRHCHERRATSSQPAS